LKLPDTMKDTKNKISFNSFNNFLEIIEYNYPVDMPTHYYIKRFQDYLIGLKREILDNVIFLNGDNKTAYLQKMLFDLELDAKHAHTTKKDIDFWLHLKDTTLEEVIKGKDNENQLISFITSRLVNFDDRNHPEFDPHKEQIQNDFYNYFYGKTIQDAIDFINEQFDISQKSDNLTTPKLKTNLSVPELATLFRELNKLKPGIFDTKSKAELHRFVANNFTSKKQDNISEKGIRKNFNAPDGNAADFWIEKMYTLIDNLKKSKEK